jgi:hypothetical protein
MGFVEGLVRLQSKAAGDDFFLDLGGAAEDRHDRPGLGSADSRVNREFLPFTKKIWPVTRWMSRGALARPSPECGSPLVERP